MCGGICNNTFNKVLETSLFNQPKQYESFGYKKRRNEKRKQLMNNKKGLWWSMQYVCGNLETRRVKRRERKRIGRLVRARERALNKWEAIKWSSDSMAGLAASLTFKSYLCFKYLPFYSSFLIMESDGKLK